MTTKKTVDNKDLLVAIQALEAKFDKKFEDIAPYINTLEDIKSAGKIFSWFIGVLMAIGGLYLMVRNVLKL